MALNALFKGKIGGSRVAAKLHILAFLALKRTQNHIFFHVFGAEILESKHPKLVKLAGLSRLR